MNTVFANAIALVLLLAITAYSTAGGVDFGAGIWDLLAGNGRRSTDARELIDRAMAPVWEVNNVWLVLSVVLCWTGFPRLFQAVFTSLYPLFALALLGLILRGAFFAFRHVTTAPSARRTANLVFGVSSVLTPFFFAAILGAVASGEVGVDGPRTSVLAACFNPMSIAFGLVSVTATALSGASFLVGDARRYGLPEMVDYFRLRAIAAAIALIVVGTLALATIAFSARQLLLRMIAGGGLPFTLAVMALTPAVVYVLWRRVFVFYRVLTVAVVSGFVLAWGFAQAPYLLPGQLTVADAVAPAATQVVLLVVAAGIALVIVPSIGVLVFLDQRGALESSE